MSDEPVRRPFAHDRLTRLADQMFSALREQDEYGEDVKCMVFLNDGKRSGIGMHGYTTEEDDSEAMADLLIHLRAIFQANGKDLMFVPFHGDPNQG